MKMDLYCVIFIVGFFYRVIALLFLAGIYNRVNRKCAFIDSSFVNVLILSTAVAVSGILGNSRVLVWV
jgi:membrane-associated protein